MDPREIAQVHMESRGPGCAIRVKVVPGASRDRLVGVLGDRLKVTVSRPPEKGAANRAVAEVLARALGLRSREVEVVQGLTNPEKVVLVRGLTADQVRDRLGGADGGVARGPGKGGGT